MLRFSSGLRNGLLSTGPLKTLLANSELRLYTGPVPASVDAAIGGSNQLICVIRNGGVTGLNFEAAAADGIIAKLATETWQGSNIATAATPVTFYRHVLPSDTDAASATAIRIQGTIAIAGADMNISNTALVNGAIQSLEAYTVALPEV
jgi:hypothetical protein